MMNILNVFDLLAVKKIYLGCIASLNLTFNVLTVLLIKQLLFNKSKYKII